LALPGAALALTGEPVTLSAEARAEATRGAVLFVPELYVTGEVVNPATEAVTVPES
jgi:hypothetical protein